ncbi:MAG: hypothetical protein JO131_03710 [Gammaproteobacteria bacterium]|nr:hypothetical protein [Gammaproteobacteria bacterium]
MKILTDSFLTRTLLFIFFALLAMSQLAPLESHVLIPNQADLINHIAAIIQAAKELDAHQFPLRIAPLQYEGLFYPYFQFYAPTSYMFAAFIYKYLIHNPYIAYKMAIWIALIFGGIYLYRLVHWLTKSTPAAILSTTVFLTMPYLNILVGALGAFNEIIAISIIPFILFYTLRDYKDPNQMKYLLLVSLGWYILITVHIITFIFSAGLIGLLLFILTLQNKKWVSLFRTFIAILFSCALATWFLAPEILFAPHFMVVSSFPNADTVYAFSATLASFLSPTLNKIMNMQQNVVTRAHESIGIPVILSVGIAIYAISSKNIFTKKNAYDYYIRPLVIIFLIAFFLLWSPFNVWRWLPKYVLVIQYPMRMLAQLMWIGPLIFAWAVCWIFNNKLDIKHAAIGILLIFAATNSLLPSLPTAPYSVKDILKKPLISFNSDSYMIDVNNNPQFVTKMGNYQLETLISQHKLVLNAPFFVPRTLLQLANSPKIKLKGYILNRNKDHYILTVKLDKQTMGTLPIKSGPLEWVVGLPLLQIKSKKDLLPLEFILKNSKGAIIKTYSDVSITTDKVELTGFQDNSHILNPSQLKDHCHVVQAELVCEMLVPKEIHFIELPMLYYPKLLKVILNGKKISYDGILSNGKVMLGIVPEVGNNNIKAKFVGLEWANLASQISWGIWSCILLIYIGKAILFQPRK